MKKYLLRGIFATALTLSVGISAQACTLCDENGVIYGDNDEYLNVLQSVHTGFNRFEEKTAVICETLSSESQTESLSQGLIDYQNAQNFSAERDLSPKTATLSDAIVQINSNQVNLAPYIIDDKAYFKLTDMALALQGTGKQFQVTWNSEASAICLETGVSQEISPILPQKPSATAFPFTSDVYRNGNAIDVLIYAIDDASYIQLDSLAQTLELSADWNQETNVIRITS